LYQWRWSRPWIFKQGPAYEGKIYRSPAGTNKKNVRTGDLGKRLPNGEIHCLGRIDNQVKIRGYRIEIGEIENTLDALPGIKEAVVLCKENKLNDPRLIAFIVTDKSGPFDQSTLGLATADINEQIKEWKKMLYLKLPTYMVPAQYKILPSLPLTPNGKIDRKSLSELTFVEEEGVSVPKKRFTENEKLIAAIWGTLLEIKNISVEENFFELGGHSLIAIEVMTRIEKLTGRKLPPSILFQYSTISKLASVLDNKYEINQWKSLVPIKPSGTKTPLYIVHGAGLDVLVFNSITHHLDADQPVYGLKAKGKDGDADTIETIEEMAYFYITEMIRQNPFGPYALLGFSAGAVLTFEMARQLISMGRKIKMLGNIDFEVAEIKKDSSWNEKIRRNIIEFFPRILQVLSAFIRHPKKAFKFQAMCTRLRYETLLSKLGLDRKTELKGLYHNIGIAMQKFEIALKKYTINPLDVRLHLFSTEIKVYYLKDKKYLGWQPYALKGIEIHKVPGDHDDMLLSPNDKEFADILQRVLDDLNKN
jgi:thioesterase domain-containing protein/acyl carrier protein